MKEKLLLLSSIPVWEVNDIRLLSPDEELFIKSLPDIQNFGEKLNFVSQNKQILEFKELSNLKLLIQHYVDYFIKNILLINDTFIITDSWTTRTPPSHVHHEHEHNNSIFSGVYYYEVPGGDLEFSFERQFSKEFNFNYSYKGFNMINASSWKISPKQGSIIIFPSWLKHSVTKNLGNIDRRVIAFNTFVSGKLGSDDELDNITIG
jgi:uncharacterized protein (TIGR02466 family)